MNISSSLFEAFLKCPTKCWLRANDETSSGNDYAEWVVTHNASFRATQTQRLLSAIPKEEYAISPPLEGVKTARWRLAMSLVAEAETDSCAVESELHTVERVPSEGRGKPACFVPIRFIFRNKLTKEDRLLLAFDAFVLGKALGRKISVGKIIHGDNHATRMMKTSALAGEVNKRLETSAALLASENPPDLVLNRYCPECEFRDRCRQKAIEADDLSLLAGMSAKERQKLRSKGIFTVTQLSYTFRPRRRPKRLRDKPEKYHHSLKALAIREQKIHIVGSPELKIEGTPVYLDVEGLPDRDFYYLIGLRIGNDDSAVQHSLWADTVQDEGMIWREFLAILETIEKPALIHYGSYETRFLTKMLERYGNASEGSTAAHAVESAVNLLPCFYGKLYFPTCSNGLKEIAGWLGFKWSESEPSGSKAIVWRSSWQVSYAPAVKAALITYNAQDCHALECLCSVMCVSLNDIPSGNCNLSANLSIVRTDAMKDERLQKWRAFKSPYPEFERLARAAHWNYQRNRVISRSRQTPRRLPNRLQSSTQRTKIYRQVVSPTSRVCPRCKKRKRGRCSLKTRYRLELFTGRSSLKVRWVKYVFETYFCRKCNVTFGENACFKDLHRFGWSLVAFFVYQVIDLNISQRKVADSFSRLFGIHVSPGTLHGLKAHFAEYYRATWRQIIERISSGHLAHADETRIHLHASSGYVWVLTNLHAVAYVFAPSREGDLPKDLLANFRGVLVSDFYAAYDSIACEHQRCLIHLIRDLNDEVLDHPDDDELKAIVADFESVLKPIIQTVDRRGLKRYYLRKFGSTVCKFFARLVKLPLTSEVALKCRQRFMRNKDELFTFLEHDGVPWNNNNAEHAIKALARLRIGITGLTTQKGLEEYLILLSVCQTCKYMGVDFLDFLRSREKDIHAFAASQPRRRCRSGSGCSGPVISTAGSLAGWNQAGS